jgi:FMN-dependent NADH-azoreductase
MKILFVDCCISQRGTESRTQKLCSAFLDAAAKAETETQIVHLDLKNMTLEPFTVEMLNRRDELSKAGDFDSSIFSLAEQFRNADGIVVGAPFWDLSFPAQLRIYIEHISANGLTYYYDEKGPHGSCRAGWLVYLTSGGDFEREGSLGVEYWKQLSGMYGIGDFHSLFAGGLDAVPERADEMMKNTCQEAAALAERLIRA